MYANGFKKSNLVESSKIDKPDGKEVVDTSNAYTKKQRLADKKAFDSIGKALSDYMNALHTNLDDTYNMLYSGEEPHKQVSDTQYMTLRSSDFNVYTRATDILSTLTGKSSARMGKEFERLNRNYDRLESTLHKTSGN